VYRACGCDACNHTGYRGRFAIFEVMPLTDALRELIVENASAETIRRQAVEEGMETLRAVGAQHLAAGDTSVEELVRVLR
jgi:type IV pilus assembly protein PilB